MFDFNSIAVGSDQVFVSQYPFSGVTTPPLALLSRGDVTINGTINVTRPSTTFYATPSFLPRWSRWLR